MGIAKKAGQKANSYLNVVDIDLEIGHLLGKGNS
jgi:hypothetical protein